VSTLSAHPADQGAVYTSCSWHEELALLRTPSQKAPCTLSGAQRKPMGRVVVPDARRTWSHDQWMVSGSESTALSWIQHCGNKHRSKMRLGGKCRLETKYFNVSAYRGDHAFIRIGFMDPHGCTSLHKHSGARVSTLRSSTSKNVPARCRIQYISH
jgi:hypothetical protein